MTKAESGLVQFSTYIAYFLMALPAGAFMKRYGYRKGIIMGLRKNPKAYSFSLFLSSSANSSNSQMMTHAAIMM